MAKTSNVRRVGLRAAFALLMAAALVGVGGVRPASASTQVSCTVTFFVCGTRDTPIHPYDLGNGNGGFYLTATRVGNPKRTVDVLEDGTYTVVRTLRVSGQPAWAEYWDGFDPAKRYWLRGWCDCGVLYTMENRAP